MSKLERTKQPPQPKPNSDICDLAQLIRLFPDIDRDYARLCLQHYTHNRVASVSEKLLDSNFGNYPKHVPTLNRYLSLEFQRVI
jgi:hypothetical protein